MGADGERDAWCGVCTAAVVVEEADLDIGDSMTGECHGCSSGDKESDEEGAPGCAGD